MRLYLSLISRRMLLEAMWADRQITLYRRFSAIAVPFDAYFLGFEAFEANLSISVLILELKSISNLSQKTLSEISTSLGRQLEL